MKRQELEAYRSGERELREIRARMREAQLAAGESRAGSDEKRARILAERYEKMARRREATLRRIEAAVESLGKVNHRRVLRYRYILGYSRAKTAWEMGLSKSRVDKLAAEAIKLLERE